VPGTADEAGAAEAEYRPLLFFIAYGITGSVGDAEDRVQHAFRGLTGARQAGTTIADPEAYLTTTVTRLGINYLHSARMRRETYMGDWLREPIVVPADGPGPAEPPSWPTRCPWRSSCCWRDPLAGAVPAIHAVVNPDSLVISDRCLMWRDCQRRNYCNTDTTDERGNR
jgi:Flp pilus assembly pilin Flp